MKPRRTKEQFIKEAQEQIGSQYDFTNAVYLNLDTKVTITCPQHGVFEKTPRAILINKQGCQQCGKRRYNDMVKTRTLTVDQFIAKSKEIHGDKYDYTKVQYKNTMQKVEIICSKHGIFEQTPNNHISGQQGCMKCFNEEKRGGLGGYTEGWFAQYPERSHLPSTFYVLRMNCGTDRFIKVGVTIQTVKQRYSRVRQGDKYINKETILTRSLPLREAFNLEQKVLRELSNYKYFPNYFFDGYTECLKDNEIVSNRICELVNNGN